MTLLLRAVLHEEDDRGEAPTAITLREAASRPSRRIPLPSAAFGVASRVFGGAPRAWGTGGTPSGGGLVITAVHLQYWTAWVEADGSAHFRKDAYQRDEPLYEAVTATPSAE